jgi:outer membrane cobalamin receptor
MGLVDTLVVTSPLSAGPGAPTTASLVTRLELDRQEGFGDVSDLLGRVAGLQMARLGGWGASAVPSLRGSAPAQIRFFVDGIPLPEAQTGLAGFGRVPLDRIAAVEVHRGVVPAGLGGIGGAGAVNFITRDREDGLDGALQLGSFGERGGRVTAGGAAADGSRAGLLMFHGHRADNNFPYLDHHQTFHTATDDTVRTRSNAWVREWGVWGSGRLETDGITARGSGGFTRRDGGRPGPLGYASPAAGVRYDRWDGQLQLEHGAGKVSADLAVGRGHEYLYDPRGEVGFAPPGTTAATNRDATTRLAWAPTLLANRLDLVTGLDWRGEHQTESRTGASGPARTRQATSAFLTLDLQLVRERLHLAPAWRWQHVRDDFPVQPAFPWLPVGPPVINRRDDVSPSVGVVWTAVAGTAYLEGHASRTVRVPTWTELFGLLGGIDGNLALRPEEITAGDLALSLRDGERMSGRVAVFSARTDDRVIFVQNSQRTSKAINLGRSTARGVEVEMALRLHERVDLNGNLTTQKVTDRGDDPAYRDKRLPFLPDLEAHARLNLRLADWRPWFEMTHQGANYRDRANTSLDRAPARTLLNFGCARDWHPAWLGPAGVLTILGEVVNLTDNAVYDVAGFPLPGRAWHLAARLRR